jgi:hypothetical protein
LSGLASREPRAASRSVVPEPGAVRSSRFAPNWPRGLGLSGPRLAAGLSRPGGDLIGISSLVNGCLPTMPTWRPRWQFPVPRQHRRDRTRRRPVTELDEQTVTRGLNEASQLACAATGLDARPAARRNRCFADSPLEEDGFEPSVPRQRTLFETAPFELAFPMGRERDRGFESLFLHRRVWLREF